MGDAFDIGERSDVRTLLGDDGDLLAFLTRRTATSNAVCGGHSCSGCRIAT